MRNLLLAGGLAAALGLPLLAAPQSADAASCSSRKTTGTIIGGVGGALLGDAVTRGAAGPIIGGVGGALVGREIGKSGCRRTVYRSAARAPVRNVAAPAPAQRVYYDQYGQPVRATQAGYAPSACRTTTRSFYDDRGRLVERNVQTCR